MTESAAVSQKSHRAWGDWLGVVFVAGIWSVLLAGLLLDIQTFSWFLVTMAVTLVMTLGFLAWWFTRRTVSWGRRLLIFLAALLGGGLIGWVSKSRIQVPTFLVFTGLPIVLAGWWVWFIATPRLKPHVRSIGLVVLLVLIWSAFLLVRVNGLQGNLRADVHWRWTPTSEELYLAQAGAGAKTTIGTTQPSARTLELQPGDWPGFRGPQRDGIVRGLRISLDWAQSPPKVLWRQRVGPAWSSMAIVNGCVFTQEQRGDRESVVCRDAQNGQILWAHDDPGRFEEGMSGPGPRATPAFAGGRIFTQGALGILNCLDASTGRVIWSRDVRKDADAAMPIWAFCSSPLISGNRVIVFAGGEGHKGLLAYSLNGGAPLWTADAGKMSYASPQELAVGNDRQILIFANEGLFDIDPTTGQIRWTFSVPARVGLPAALQACVVSPEALVIGNGAAFGTQRIAPAAESRPPSRQWITPRMKPAFSDMVYHDGFLYDFDGTVFCCIDAATGERRWREGRYGAGQVVLLADQGVMIVTSEEGEAILLRCNPQHHEELGRLPAVSGKAWNHPAIAQGRLYVRSDAEMACIQLTPLGER